MLTLGAKKEQMGHMHIDHIFLGRLRLLLIMLKAYGMGYPIGKYRLQGILHNAKIVGDEATHFLGLPQIALSIASTEGIFHLDRELCEHIKILTLLTEKIEADKDPNKQLIESMNGHLDYLIGRLFSGQNLPEMSFLKVA